MANKTYRRGRNQRRGRGRGRGRTQRRTRARSQRGGQDTMIRYNALD
jgi:hypothetical protein